MSTSLRGIRPLTSALNASGKYSFKKPELEVDHLVVGAGVVGLAIAERLARKYPDKSTIVVDRHGSAGQETSSRNSEVIHAGIYYPPKSLKTHLCLRGKKLLYDRANSNGIPYKRLQKLVVAPASQREYIQRLHTHCQRVGAPSEIIDGTVARELEPDLGDGIGAALLSTSTGIVESHALLEDLEAGCDAAGAQRAYGTSVVRVDAGRSDGGFIVQTRTGDGSNDTDAMRARTLINAAGLTAPLIFNALMPSNQAYSMFFARGSYASYNGSGARRVKRLLYPVPDDKSHGFASLGTHLTLDMQGKVRFGPDIEWLNPPENASDADANFWSAHLVPDESRLDEMHAAITTYLPNIERDKLQPDYCGIRPKLIGPGEGFQDFVIRKDGDGNEGIMMSLLGIESPGLTSSLAIAELVVDKTLVG